MPAQIQAHHLMNNLPHKVWHTFDFKSKQIHLKELY